MELVIRGGTHEESAFIPGTRPCPRPRLASRQRHGRLVPTAWFDKYVKCEPGPACARTPTSDC